MSLLPSFFSPDGSDGSKEEVSPLFSKKLGACTFLLPVFFLNYAGCGFAHAATEVAGGDSEDGLSSSAERAGFHLIKRVSSDGKKSAVIFGNDFPDMNIGSLNDRAPFRMAALSRSISSSISSKGSSGSSSSPISSPRNINVAVAESDSINVELMDESKEIGLISSDALTGVSGAAASDSTNESLSLNRDYTHVFGIEGASQQYTINVPLVLGSGEELGMVPLAVGFDGVASLDKSYLLRFLRDRLNSDAYRKLSSAYTSNEKYRSPVFTTDSGTSSNYVSIVDIRNLGFDFRYNNFLSRVEFFRSLSQAAVEEISLGVEAAKPPPRSRNIIQPTEPEPFSAYVNLRNSYTVDHLSGGTSDYRLGFDGAIRVSSAVLSYDGFYDDKNEDFRLGSLVLTYDDLQNQVRYRFGEISVPTYGYQGGARIAGFNISKRVGSLGYSATGSRETFGDSRNFEILNTSTVEIFSGLRLLQSKRMDPGTYNIKDLQLDPGINEVTIVVEDDDGRRSVHKINTFIHSSPLAPGEFEFDVSGGLERTGTGDIFSIYEGSGVLSANARTGFGNLGTWRVGFQIDDSVAMIDAGAVVETQYGTVSPSVGFSSRFSTAQEKASAAPDDSSITPSYAARLTYSTRLKDIFGGSGEGVVSDLESYDPSLNISISTKGESFSAVNSSDEGKDIKYDLAGAYSQRLADGYSAVLSGNYSVVRNPDDQDTYGVNLSLYKSFNDKLSASASMGHSFSQADGGDTVFSVNLNYAFDNYLGGRISFDNDGNLRTNFYGAKPTEYGSLVYGVNLNSPNGSARTYDFDANVAYSGAFFTASADHSIGFDSTNSADPGPYFKNSTVRFNTALAVAGRSFSIMKPIGQGSSFLIFEPHKSLEGKDIYIKNASGSKYTKSYIVSPAVGGLPAYRRSSYVVAVDDLPLGYDLGEAGPEIVAVPSGGYVYIVGGDATVVAVGYLLDGYGDPLGRGMFGKVYPAQYSSESEAAASGAVVVDVFTNEKGRFSAQGLENGDWKVDLVSGKELSTYLFNVPESSVGLYNIGFSLRPVNR